VFTQPDRECVSDCSNADDDGKKRQGSAGTFVHEGGVPIVTSGFCPPLIALPNHSPRLLTQVS